MPAFADDFSNAMKQMFEQIKQESIPYYKNLENCTPFSYQNGMQVIEGQNGSYCYMKTYMMVNDQKYPFTECKIPMNVVKSYAQEKINELEQGSFSFDSSNDKLNSYCTNVSTSMTISY